MKVVVTGANGFIGRNLRQRLAERGDIVVAEVVRETSADERRAALQGCDVVFHLAGVNRPPDPRMFVEGNAGVTAALCAELRALRRAVPVVYASSAQAVLDNPYGRSKRAAEEELERYREDMGAPTATLRLWNVFGKWARPDYNSAVATFCHNVARDLPIQVNDPAARLRLVYIDDVVEAMMELLESRVGRTGLVEVGPVHDTTVGAVAAAIRGFAENRHTLSTGSVGTGLEKALYATYMSYLPPAQFSYGLTRHEDPRGSFAEWLRTPNAGQVSFFTAHPGVTRGGHYHHTKTEKFLVLHGRARFRFRNVVTGERHELLVHGDEARVVETVPGWAHDVTNIGDGELIVALWANEPFDPLRPDTIPFEVGA